MSTFVVLKSFDPAMADRDHFATLCDKFDVSVEGFLPQKPEGYCYSFVRAVLSGDNEAINDFLEESGCDVRKMVTTKSRKEQFRLMMAAA